MFTNRRPYSPARALLSLTIAFATTMSILAFPSARSKGFALPRLDAQVKQSLKSLLGPAILWLLALAVFNLAANTAMGQTGVDGGQQVQQSSSTVTVASVAASGEAVRFVAPGTVVQLRLEVYADSGLKVFDTELRGGNVLDWHLQDGAGQRLGSGSYACVMTIKSLSGRISQRLGLIAVEEKKAEMLASEAAQLTLAQQQAIGPLEADRAFTILPNEEAITAVTHDGTEGQLNRTRGALSFRVGDFFSGKDAEQMRLTEEGNLGIGTSEPRFKLDVLGAIRARQGFVFNDGSILNVNDKGALTLTDSDGNITPNAAGTGTQNTVAKWSETGGSGTLTDSSIFDNGNVGIGTTNPANKLDVVRGSPGFMSKGLYEMASFERDTDAKFGVYSSAPGPGLPSAALTLGSTNQQVAGLFPGFELQYVYGATSAANQARFNYIERNGTGTVTNFAANLLTINGNGDVTLNPVTNGVTATPRLGIGTTNPLRPLHSVSSTISNEFIMEVANGLPDWRKWNFVVDGGAGQKQNIYLRILNDAGTSGILTAMSWFNDGTVIIPGRVGIGTQAPSDKLVVQTAANTFGLVDTDGTVVVGAWTGSDGDGSPPYGGLGTKTNHPLRLFTNNDQNSAGAIVIDTNGKVGMGARLPAEKLQVIGNIRIGNFGTNGCLQRFDGGTLTGTCASDARFKKDVTPFRPVLRSLTAIQPIHYYWRAKEFPERHFGNTRNYGLVAQDVEQVLPELVVTDDDGYKAVDYSKLPLLTIQAVKELTAENDALKRRVAKLVARAAELDGLKARVARLERLIKELRATGAHR